MLVHSTNSCTVYCSFILVICQCKGNIYKTVLYVNSKLPSSEGFNQDQLLGLTQHQFMGK